MPTHGDVYIHHRVTTFGYYVKGIWLCSEQVDSKDFHYYNAFQQMLKRYKKMKEKTDPKEITQALQNCLANIPFLQMGEITANESMSGPDFLIEIRIKNRSLTIIAEYKTNGQPRIARSASYQIKDWLEKGIGVYGILIAPYISPVAADICEEAGIGYIDLAGNCLLSFETVFIRREGKDNTRIQRRNLRSLYSKKAERILRVLLTETRQYWKTETLAQIAKVSYGQISNVKAVLADREWLSLDQDGIKLSDPSAVLNEWTTQYRYKRSKFLDYYAMADIAECEYKLAETCQSRKIRYALTAFSGAARLAPAVRYQRVTAYIDGDVGALSDTLGWKRVTSGANVSLLVPYDEGVFFNNQEIDGVQIVSPLQIYLDLQDYSSRGQEAAQSIRKVIEKSWQ